jgi:hypothetical protein
MVFKNSLDGKILHLIFVKRETLLLYEAGIKEISRRGIEIQSIICDEKPGIFAMWIKRIIPTQKKRKMRNKQNSREGL